MTTFSCTYEEFRKLAGDYLKSIKNDNLSLEELDAGKKCVALHYLGMEAAHEHENAGAAAVMRIMTREYLAAEAVLLEKAQ